VEDKKLNKKNLYAHYIEEEKKRNLEVGYNIDSKIILFLNLEINIKDALIKVINYYHRKDIDVKRNDYYSPLITFMFIGFTGTGKSTMINEINGEKIAYSSSENQMKTSLKGKKLVYKNGKYPILNQDTEGFEIANKAQIDQVNKNIDKNIGIHLNNRVHIVIYLAKDNRGLDNCDVPLLIKLHKMKILYYFIFPKKEGLTQLLQNKAKRLINVLINKIKNNEEEVRELFKDDNKNETLKILEQIQNKLEETVFSADILTPNSKGVIALLEQIKKDLSIIYDIHQKYINIVEELENTEEKMKIGISGNISYENNNDYIKILDDSPFFFKHSIDDIKRKEADKLLDNCDVSFLWFFLYNNKIETFRRELLKKIKNIYSEVKIDTEIDTNNFSFEESWFYKNKITKEYINKLIDFFAEKYKEIKLNKKYYSMCKQEETFKNCKLND
jgi:GTPase Era involved in 16S rRNA processing